MNGLALRINKGGGKKSKNTNGFAPLEFLNFPSVTLGKENILLENFKNARNADEQLEILKKILEKYKDMCDDDTGNFLAVVFFYAETKHPVKSFLARYITRNSTTHQPFTDALVKQLNAATTTSIHTWYKEYIEVVSKLAACIENFPAGAAAMKITELTLAGYLISCLDCCVRTLKATETLSPTEKNEIYNLAHLALRLFLHIVQKLSPDQSSNMAPMFKDIRVFIKHLLFDEEVPMDTKSVCGILFLAINSLEIGPDSWVQVLNPEKGDESLNQLLSVEASKLALYSAIATAVSVGRLQSGTVDAEPAILVLCSKILAIGERSSSDSIFSLGVARSLLQISRSLGKLSDRSVALQLVGKLQQFVWGNLEHYMDSVRHLTAQLLGHVVKFCSRLKVEGDSKALDNLFSTLSSLDRSRKSYYLCVTALAAELGAASMFARSPELLAELIAALSSQPVQASATTALETLLQKHVRESDTEAVYSSWVQPILRHVGSSTLDSGVLNILEHMLAAAVRMDDGLMDYILPYIKQSCETTKTHDLKCILMLLSVARKSGVTNKLTSDENEEWKGVISYEVLRAAAVDSVEETRILSLSLVVESPKTTEVFTQEELNFILYFLKYNINSQSPNFRQLTLSVMKKFVKRLEDSYKVLKRQNNKKEDYYTHFLEELRGRCFCSLVEGANYTRRAIALQMLAWAEKMHFEGYQRIWNEVYVEKLLLHLEDSYENNKAFALEILEKCPVDLLTRNQYSISLLLDDILQQASSLKPTDCVSASYKLELLKKKLPERILQNSFIESSEPVSLCLLRRLQSCLLSELSVCERSVALAAAHAPLYGLLHCATKLIAGVDAGAIAQDDQWTSLVNELIATCMKVNAAVACVVNNSSPEGHLPMDMGGVVVTDHGNTGGLALEDGRQVTAQMVLLCAWRSVKEVSLLLGEISSRLSIQGEGIGGTLCPAQLVAIGEHFTRLLAETKHRGAFEQAYVGFTKLLARLWRCVSPSLHCLPREWLSQLMRAIEDSQPGALCATRRSAGLPFMIQALVTTELQVQGSGKCFHECMGTLLRLARSSIPAMRETEAAIEVRAHSTNILRALFRNSALDESVAPYVGEGLKVAMQGFGGRTWMERNSATLLFSALAVRVFGVQRSRDSERLCVRNRMTGRIFFLRYPDLYDYMLDKLKEVSSSEDSQILRPSLYPVLLLLARLYPSSLEGTVSNLKLVAFVPLVVSCAGADALPTRRLAARAIVPLIAPHQYMSHVESMFDLICDVNVKRNYCHGILLQLIRLLDARPDNLVVEEEVRHRLGSKIKDTLWILKQTLANVPCYLLADEYVKVLHFIIWRFPTLIQQDLLKQVQIYSEEILFVNKRLLISSGRDICLANVLNLYFVILNKYDEPKSICELIYKSLTHKSYEVVLTVLNYLLILHENLEIETKFQEHLSLISNKNALEKLRENETYVSALCDVYKNNKYLECTQKSLKILTLESNTEKYIVEVKMKDKTMEINSDSIISTLFECIQNEHENLTHIYLESLCKFVTEKLKDYSISGGRILEMIRVVFACSSSDNSVETRNVVVGFLERSFKDLLEFNLEGIKEDDIFEYKATLCATMVTILEDDDAEIRQRTSNTVWGLRSSSKVVPSLAAETAREVAVGFGEAHSLALLVALALLDFRSEVCLSDDVSEECRVFDQNERYNIFLEETIWTKECADRIAQLHNDIHVNAEYIVQNVTQSPVYRRTLDKLCCNNVRLFEKMVEGTIESTKEVVNPKIKIFIDTLNRNISNKF